MKLQDVFSQLAYGELSQVVQGTLVNGVVDPVHHPALVSHINLGLTALFKRFNLKEGSLTLSLIPGKLVYPLTKAYAVSTMESIEPVRHILDSSLSPFLGDCLKVEKVFTQSNWEMGLNDLSDPYTCTTSSMTTLVVPEPVVSQRSDLPDELKTSTLRVVYRANHPLLVIEENDFFPEEIELELPDSHLEALLYFIASRVNNPIGMGQEFNAGNNWNARYEQECMRLESLSLQIHQGTENDRFSMRGWI